MTQYTPSRNARVNGICKDSWSLYAAGFKRAAELLIANVRSTYEINTVIFPILFLYRQHLELSLKETIGYGYYLDEESKQVPGGHNLNNLWRQARAYICKNLSDVPVDELDNIERLIFDFHAIDPTSEGSRYPVIKKGKQGCRSTSFSWDSPNINLDELAAKMTTIGMFLDKVTNYLSVAQDLEAELRSDYYSDCY